MTIATGVDAAPKGAIQQPPDPEPAQAEPIPDLFLAEVHPVVHLRDAHHQPRVARFPTQRCGHRSSGFRLHI